MKTRWKAARASQVSRMQQIFFWLSAILILCAGNCKKHLSYSFATLLVLRVFPTDWIWPFSFRTELFVSTCMYTHSSLHLQDLSTSFALHWGFFGVLIPWEVAGSFLGGLGLTDESMLPSSGIMLRTCSPPDEEPSVTHLLTSDTPPC